MAAANPDMFKGFAFGPGDLYIPEFDSHGGIYFETSVQQNRIS